MRWRTARFGPRGKIVYERETCLAPLDSLRVCATTHCPSIEILTAARSDLLHRLAGSAKDLEIDQCTLNRTLGAAHRAIAG